MRDNTEKTNKYLTNLLNYLTRGLPISLCCVIGRIGMLINNLVLGIGVGMCLGVVVNAAFVIKKMK